MKLIVGLGNPGPRYANNRHNIGFMAIDAIADHLSLPNPRSKFQGDVFEASIGGEKVLLLKPMTYMNESGRSVQEVMRFYKIELGDLIVFHDELDLKPGKLKVKVGGGHAGHNGLRSIMAHCGEQFVRVRMGIGHPGDKALVHNHVLGDFAKIESKWLNPQLDAIAKNVRWLVKNDNARFMTNVAQALQPPKKPKTEAEGNKGQNEQPALTATQKAEQPKPPAGTMADKLMAMFGKNKKDS